MNLTFIHYAAPPVVGGVESVMGHQARLAAEAGHFVQVLAGRGQQVDERIAFLSNPLLDSRSEEVLAVKRELDAGQVPPAFATLSARLETWLAEKLAAADVVICHNICSLNKNLALTAALWRLCEQHTSPRFILWHHDLAWSTPRYQPELHEGYPWDLLRRDWPAAAQVVVSELRQEELCALLKVPASRVQVIPNGLDIPRFFKLEAQTLEFIRRLDLLRAEPLLLLPVRITPRKNIELALQTLAALRCGAFPAARLVVTGPLGPHNPANVTYFKHLGDLRASLALQQAAHFLAELSPDYLPDEVIADFYRIADALLLPSREEGFGIPILEAGLSHLPIFCSDIAPLRKLGGAEAHYFSPDAGPHKVAEIIALALSANPASRLAGRVRREYSWEGIYTNKIELLLKGLMTNLPTNH